MEQNESSELIHQKLMEGSKKNKTSPIVDAFFIGFLVGIIIYSIAVNSWGFLSLIPLFLIYRLLKKSKKNEAVKNE